MKLRRCIVALLLAALFGPAPVFAAAECPPLEEHPVKLEGWLSKRYEGRLPGLVKEFAAMGHTRVTLWVYPAENPSGIVAIGRCVPVYIAQHAIRGARAYTAGVNSLVHQNFVGPNWIGVGTNLFAELARQPVTDKQVEQLLDENLTTREFQTLYRRLTIQDKTTHSFGIDLPNPKLMRD
ncbi:MAG: hypothetical protein ACE5G9_08060 [Nitrospinales bacterium]